MQDWDDPNGAIDWPRLRAFLREVKTSGRIPDTHKSHDHLNEQKAVTLQAEVFDRWKKQFERIVQEASASSEEVVWGLVDGFLLYWDDVRSIRLGT